NLPAATRGDHVVRADKKCDTTIGEWTRRQLHRSPSTIRHGWRDRSWIDQRLPVIVPIAKFRNDRIPLGLLEDLGNLRAKPLCHLVAGLPFQASFAWNHLSGLCEPVLND